MPPGLERRSWLWHGRNWYSNRLARHALDIHFTAWQKVRLVKNFLVTHPHLITALWLFYLHETRHCICFALPSPYLLSVCQTLLESWRNGVYRRNWRNWIRSAILSLFSRACLRSARIVDYRIRPRLLRLHLDKLKQRLQREVKRMRIWK